MKYVLLPPEFTDCEKQLLELRDRLNTPVVDSGFAESLVEAYKKAEATSLRTLESLDDAICSEMLADESLDNESMGRVFSDARGQRNINANPPSTRFFGMPKVRPVLAGALAGALLATTVAITLWSDAKPPATTERPCRAAARVVDPGAAGSSSNALVCPSQSGSGAPGFGAPDSGAPDSGAPVGELLAYTYDAGGGAGDPHLLTFDGANCDLQVGGELTLGLDPRATDVVKSWRVQQVGTLFDHDSSGPSTASADTPLGVQDLGGNVSEWSSTPRLSSARFHTAFAAWGPPVYMKVTCNQREDVPPMAFAVSPRGGLRDGHLRRLPDTNDWTRAVRGGLRDGHLRLPDTNDWTRAVRGNTITKGELQRSATLTCRPSSDGTVNLRPFVPPRVWRAP